jgi:hypothetical protein
MTDGTESDETITQSSFFLQLSRKGFSPPVIMHTGMCVVLRA